MLHQSRKQLTKNTEAINKSFNLSRTVVKHMRHSFIITNRLIPWSDTVNHSRFTSAIYMLVLSEQKKKHNITSHSHFYFKAFFASNESALLLNYLLWDSQRNILCFLHTVFQSQSADGTQKPLAIFTDYFFFLDSVCQNWFSNIFIYILLIVI